mmetsp:Transcript_38836/g.61970  ORF Transcript_38836/g.61970 Transcript_38836/m.61970 type:complete len:489 (-) Transcript_38836:725-2191(-)|eukprot:CAMPEP_0197073160 /NCGR_PEP_ID=MMETSP1384-20130603/210467_1 /TAXON_ID=29189 /ORGANISM="Ammonia sp." /LENGTH=488 /DNA_ID=CAMNT_0042511991 /DNA_START=29 /DNA_END=1495 /DNA_ORIENTATION=+
MASRVTSAPESSYTPFEKELLTHLCQISTNVNTLIEVFVNLQSSLLQQNKSTHSASASSVPSSAHSSPLKSITVVESPPSESQHAAINHSTETSELNSAIILQELAENNQEEEKHEQHHAVAQQPLSTHKENEETEDKKDAEQNTLHEEDEPEPVVLSLDSSDTDNETAPSSSTKHTHTRGNIHDLKRRAKSSQHLSTNSQKVANKHKDSTAWKRGNKYGLNRSKSTSSPSASMTSLLRANHLRNHRYTGILKHKYKKKSHHDHKSEPVANGHHTHTNGVDYGPKFNPDHVFLSKDNRIMINVGGSLYETTLNTLSSDQTSMLSAMFSGRFNIERDGNGSIFIDRDPTHFRHILNFLRDGIEYLKHGGLLQQSDAIVSELLQEAKYYNIRPLVDYIQLQQTRKNKKKGDELTHEKQYKLVTNIGIDEFEDVFNKYTGSAGYDFEEWLYIAPYKTSRNSVSSPTFIILFSKKLSRAEVRLLDRLTNDLL